MKKLIFIILSGLFLSSCQKENNPISSDMENVVFPTTIGSNWEYIVKDTTYYYNFGDSIIVKNGVLEVQIIKSTFLDNNKKALLWQYTFNDIPVDTLFVNFSNDTLLFYNDRTGKTINKMFLFPLKVNKEWQLDSCNKYKVIKQESLDFSFGTLKDIFCIENKFICEGEASLVKKYYINSSIGIVKEQSYYKNIHYGIINKKNCILKSYSIGK